MKILVTGGSGFIGTNLHEYCQENHPQIQIINVDIVPPKIQFPNSHWEDCNIMDLEKLNKVFASHHPDVVVHLAAETSCEPHLSLADYDVNIEGSANVFRTASETVATKKVIHTSTQFVNQTDFPLEDFLIHKPYTVYGESKAQSELLLINNSYDFSWVIIRPTNVWGKWHLRYPQEFWKVLKTGKYVHPNKKDVVRSYGYVENICFQIMKMIKDIERIDREIFYVGDEPIELYKWVNEFSLALRGRKVRVVPKQLVYMLAIVGDFLELFRIKFPITRSRYRSMTLSNPAPMEKTLKFAGAPVTLKEGVKKTSEWLMKEVYNKQQ